jgi:uncharacterized Zn-binding protein involved in type VI secretion
MPPAARIGDFHMCPMVTGLVPHVGGPIAKGCQTVLIGGSPAARIGDLAICEAGPPDLIAQGAPTVLIGGMPAARMGDMTAHGGVVMMGCFTVLIGESAEGNSLSSAAESGAPLVRDCGDE